MIDFKIGVLVILLFASLVLLGLSVLIQTTNGLFWSRRPQEFLSDREDPIFETERQVGQWLSEVLLKYVPKVAITLLILLIATWFR